MDIFISIENKHHFNLIFMQIDWIEENSLLFCDTIHVKLWTNRVRCAWTTFFLITTTLLKRVMICEHKS